MKVAIPRMGETVAPCFEYCTTMAVFTTAGAQVLEQADYPLRSREALDRVRLLRDRNVDAVICGGIQGFYEDVLEANGFEVVSWVSGLVEELLALYLRGGLESGMELPTEYGPDFPTMDRITES